MRRWAAARAINPCRRTPVVPAGLVQAGVAFLAGDSLHGEGKVE